MLRSLTRLQRYYLYYTGGFLVFIGALAILEQHVRNGRYLGGIAHLLRARLLRAM